MDRPQYYRIHQGQKQLPFPDAEYETRLGLLRQTMRKSAIDACVLTSMHNVSYYSGFLYCSFGRPYALVVTQADSVTISAGIDAAHRDDFVVFAADFDHDDNGYLKKAELEDAAKGWNAAHGGDGATEEAETSAEEEAPADVESGEEKACTICGTMNAADASKCMACDYDFTQ